MQPLVGLFLPASELKAVRHVFQHTTIDVLIRCDCKRVVTLVSKILCGRSYDPKHNDADLLEAIQTICHEVPTKRIIEWMHAHLDEEEI